MPPVFLHPLAFWGLLAVLALAAIYLLRNRHRRYPVSSLMLWLDPREAREGGTRIHRLQTPLLFFLELLVILLLVLAAAGPHVPIAGTARPLVVVLDDSFSMLAGGDSSPRSRAMKALEEELHRSGRPSVRFVLAGDRAVLLGEPVRTAAEAAALLEQWSCRSPSAALEDAVGLASEVGGEWAHLLVVTDHPPAAEPGPGRVQWWAFGSPRPNLAFVNAARTARDGPERCLLEVANLSADPQSTTLLIEAGDPPAEVQRSDLQLEAGETRRLVLQLPEGTPALHARLGPDDLAIDNEVTLLPAVHRPVRVAVRVRDEALRPPVEKAVRAARGALLTDTRPEVVFTDADGPADEGADAWVVRLLAEKDASAYAGPFVLDRAHPLTEGLALQGVIWGGGKTEGIPGAPVVMAGNVPLLTDAESLAGRHEVRLRLRPDLSTLQDSPGWPILVWNLVQWHASLGPGLSRSNVRLGEEVILTLPTGKESVEVIAPGRPPRTQGVQGRRVVVRAEEVGIHEVRTDGGTCSFAVNALARDESDLRGCASGRWGDWLDEASLHREYHGIAWAVLLLALGVLAVHMLLVARGRGA